MHEASLMAGLFTVIEKTVRDKNVKNVNYVTIAVGRISNALPDALTFAFDAMKREASRRERFGSAELIIKDIPVCAHCEECGEEYEPSGFPFVCPGCGCRLFSITRGEDIYIESIDCEF